MQLINRSESRMTVLLSRQQGLFIWNRYFVMESGYLFTFVYLVIRGYTGVLYVVRLVVQGKLIYVRVFIVFKSSGP